MRSWHALSLLGPSSYRQLPLMSLNKRTRSSERLTSWTSNNQASFAIGDRASHCENNARGDRTAYDDRITHLVPLWGMNPTCKKHPMPVLCSVWHHCKVLDFITSCFQSLTRFSKKVEQVVLIRYAIAFHWISRQPLAHCPFVHVYIS